MLKRKTPMPYNSLEKTEVSIKTVWAIIIAVTVAAGIYYNTLIIPLTNIQTQLASIQITLTNTVASGAANTSAITTLTARVVKLETAQVPTK